MGREILCGVARPDGDGTAQETLIFLASFEGLGDNLRPLIGTGADLDVVDRDSRSTALWHDVAKAKPSARRLWESSLAPWRFQKCCACCMVDQFINSSILTC